MQIPTKVGGTKHKSFKCGKCDKIRKLGSWWNEKLGTVCKKCELELWGIKK